MMGYGPSVGHPPSSSSSSSWSTLSPLAQPFTVDRPSAPKPHKPAALPSSALEEHLNYVPPRPSLDNWLHLHPPTPASHPIPSPSSDIDSIHGGCVYYGSSLTGSDGNHSPSWGSVGSGFSYGQKTGSVAAISLVDAEPYYPQYTPAIHEKGELEMKESGLGLPKTVGASTIVEASPSDYVQNLSGFGYNPVDWTGPWKEVESSWKCPSGKTVVSNYGSSFQRESHATEGFMEEWSGGTQRKDMQASVRKIHISSTGTGSEWLDIKCTGISDDDTNLASYKMTKASAMTPGSAFKQMSYSQLPDPTSPREDWNPYHQSPASYDISVSEHETANPTNFFPFSVPYSSPAQAFGLPASCPISTSVAVSPQNMSPIGGTMELHNMKEVANNLHANFKVPSMHLNATSKGFTDASITSNNGDGFIFAGCAGHVSANVKMPGVQLNAEDGKESYSARKNNDRRGAHSPMNRHLAHSKAPKFITGESSVYSLKSKFEQEHPHVLASRPTVKISMPMNPKAAVNNSLSQCSEAKSEPEQCLMVSEAKSELEQCLMGPSPVKAGSALNLTPNVDDSSNPSSMAKSEQELPQLKLPNASSAPVAAAPSDSVQSSSETFDQFLSAVDSPCWKGVSGFRRSPFGVTDAVATMSVEKGLDGQNGLNQHFHISSLIDNDNVEIISSPKHGCFAQAEGWCAEASFSANQSGTQSSSSVKEQGNSDVISSNHFGCKATESSFSKEDAVTSSQPAPNSGIADDAAQNSSTEFHSAAGECGSNVSSAAVSSVISEILGASYNSSVQPLHIRMTVMMMFYASELLRNSSLLKEQDHEVLRLVVDNLQACLSKNDGLTKQTPQSFPLKDMKKVMEKGIHEQDEENPQVSLYKNLWLEAEAALCSMKHELAHLKIKMEQDQANGELSLLSPPISGTIIHILPPVKSTGVATDSNSPLDGSGKPFIMKPSCSSEFTATSVDVYFQEAKENSTEKVAVVGDHVNPSNPAKPMEVNRTSMKENTQATSLPKTKESLTENVATIGNNDCSSQRDLAELYQPIREEAEDVESSVMARFRVLKSRIDYLNCPSKVDGQKQPVPVVSGGVMPHCLEDKMESSKPWPFITDQSGDRCLEVGNSYEERCLLGLEVGNSYEEQCLLGLKVGNSYEEPCLLGFMGETRVGSDASKQCELTEGFRLHVADLPANHPYMEGTLGSYFQTSGYESPSSDWEHVLKEDLKWH